MSSTHSNNSLALATKLVGTPYLANGRNPVSGLDCWGLYWYFLTYFGKPVPDGYDYEFRSNSKHLMILTESAKSNVRWKLLEKPVDLCLVAFSKKYVSHVGLWLEEANMVLHATEDHGTVCEELLAIKRKRNLNYKFYQWQAFT